jgi:hypothetical protein
MRANSFFAFSAFLFTTAAVAIAACGGKTGASSSSSSAASALVTAQCNKLAQCEPINLQVTFGDVDTCVLVEGQAQVPGAISDADLAACTQAIESADCNVTDLAACDFHGTVPIGGVCSASQLCVSGAACTYTTSPCGTCVAYATAGQSCAIATCAPGLTCNVQQSAQPVCVTPIPVGGACTTTGNPCMGTYACIGGTCAAPLEAGGSCAVNTNACDENNDTFCVNGTCVAPSLAKAGEPCGQTGPAVATACTGLYVACVPTDDAGASTCVAPIAAGSPCGGSIPATCAFPMSCVNGVCSDQGEDAGTCP